MYPNMRYLIKVSYVSVILGVSGAIDQYSLIKKDRDGVLSEAILPHGFVAMRLAELETNDVDGARGRQAGGQADMSGSCYEDQQTQSVYSVVWAVIVVGVTDNRRV